MYLDVTLPDDAADMRLYKWLDKHMESIKNAGDRAVGDVVEFQL